MAYGGQIFSYAELIAAVRDLDLSKLRLDPSLCSELFSNKATLNVKRKNPTIRNVFVLTLGKQQNFIFLVVLVLILYFAVSLYFLTLQF